MGLDGPSWLRLRKILEVAAMTRLVEGQRYVLCVAAGQMNLWSRLFPVRPAWVWCAPAALSSRRSPLDGGGGSFPRSCEDNVPCSGDVLCLYLIGQAAVFTKKL
jgi:hypothetical protein